MIDHLQGHFFGLIHVLFALAAIMFGTIVIFNRKGTYRHKWLGRCFLVSMLLMNATSFLLYHVFGGFGPFHWLALFSLVTLLAGYQAARSRSSGWRARHAYFMSGAYMGLIAATAAEIASRVPGWSFGASVFISSAVISIVGLAMMFRLVPRTL